jgi:hypothetical protein
MLGGLELEKTPVVMIETSSSGSSVYFQFVLVGVGFKELGFLFGAS